MQYANKRAQGIAMIRAHARERVSIDGEKKVHRELLGAMDAIIQEFRVEFDVPGIRYWEHPETATFFAIAPGEMPPADCPNWPECVELTRDEFLSRQGLHFGYDDRL